MIVIVTNGPVPVPKDVTAPGPRFVVDHDRQIVPKHE